jgi:phage RecT family recombinase
MNTAITQIIEGVTDPYKTTIHKHNYDLIPASQLLAAQRQIEKNDFCVSVALNNQQSLHDSVMTAAILGLDFTEGKREAWLLPRSKKVKEKSVWYIALQVGYRGYESIHQRLGIIKSVSLRVVREGDIFEWDGDDRHKPNHSAGWFEPGRSKKPIIGAFCVTYFPDHTINVVTTDITTIYEKHRNVSDSWKAEDKRKYSPWFRFEEQMILKTMLVIAAKQWPASKMSESQASPVLEQLHVTDVDDYTLEEPSQQDPRFMGFMLDNDCLGMYLLSLEYMKDGGDSPKANEWINLYNSFPKGFIVENKQRVEKMINQGMDILTAIKDYLRENDAYGLYENIPTGATSKKMLSEHVGTANTAIIKSLLSSIPDEGNTTTE